MVVGTGPGEFNESPLVTLCGRVSSLPRALAHAPSGERLARWIGWADAIALSAALSTVDRTGHASERSVQVHAAQLQQLRREHSRPLSWHRTDLAGGSSVRNTPTASQGPESVASELKQSYRARQHGLQTAVAELRKRVRHSLADAGLRRLAAIDAVMEQATAPHEQELLSSIPDWLAARLAQWGAGGPANDGDDPSSFLDEVHTVLIAEVDHRLRPVDGLIAALAARQQTQTT